MAVVEAVDLTKTYTYHVKEPGLRGSFASLFRRRTLERRAVDGVSFSVQRGEIVGFIGANGAGKTTALKMLCGLLYPTGGTARVLGFTPQRRDHAMLRRIALVMGQKSVLWEDLPAMEMLRIYRAYRETGEFESLQRYGAAHARRLGVRDERDVERLIRDARSG